MTGQGSFWFGSSDFYPGVATRSLRFDDGDSAHLTFTPSSASSAADRRKITHAVWIKRGNIGTYQSIYSSTKSGGGDYYLWRFNDNNTMTIFLDVDDSNFAYDGTEVYRDTTNWYHFVLIIDTTQSSASNRIKLYANGVQQTLSNKYGSDVSQNFETYVMDGTEDAIGEFNFNSTVYFDGYMCDFITTVGQDTSISDFGETKNGVWIAKDYSGSYGANGFRLQFDQTGTGTASASTIGADVSGNTNHWTSNNLVASDSNLPDSPENNFAVWNALFKGGEQSSSIYANSTLSEGNLQVSVPTNSYMGSTFRPTSGKWYAEIRVKTIGSTNGEIDWGWLQATTYSGSSGHSGQANKWGVYYHAYSTDHIRLYDETSQLGSNINLTISAGDILQLAWDIDNGKGWIGINNTYYAADNGTDGNPSAGTNQTFDFTADEAQNLQVYVANGTGTDVHTVNFGQDDTFAGAISSAGNADANGKGAFKYAVPTGFLACCSANLPDVTIGPDSVTQADDHFDTQLWSGDSSSTRDITSYGFKPDWSWIKNRSAGNIHNLHDSSRGVSSSINTSITSGNSDPEGLGVNHTSTTVYGGVSAFLSNGFTLKKGSTDARYVNKTSNNYVGWSWKANGGTTSSNTNGTITSTVQANTDAGFSIVTYTSNNTAGATVGHGLGKVPAMIITKNREDDRNWGVYHHKVASDPETDGLFLNLTNALSDSASYWNDTAPTSTVFSLGSGAGETNFPASDGFVAYCFAEIEGYSKFGGYTANGNADGTYIFLGFRPAFLIIKETDNSGPFIMFDNKRNTFNEVSKDLSANTFTAEDTGVYNDIDFLSNGFKIRDFTNSEPINRSSGATYIYMAFAEQPFKFSNAR